MRIIFAGSPAVALPALQHLVDSTHDVTVLSRPDAPRGRGRKLYPSEVANYAQNHALPLYQPASLKNNTEAETYLREFSPDLGVVVAYGALIPQRVLDIPQHGWINVHFSLLPRWRGAAPVQRAIEAQDTTTGVTVFRLEATLDTGPIYATATYRIPPQYSAGQVLTALSELALQPLDVALEKIATGTTPQPQSQTGITYASQLKVAEGKIDWTQDATKIRDHIRGFTPNPGAWTQLGDLRLKVGVPRTDAEPTLDSLNLQPAEILSTRHELWVGTGSTPVCLGLLAPAGKKHMEATDWARGARLQPGAHFATGKPNETDPKTTTEKDSPDGGNK